MINPKDIRISQIENLQAIFFYSIDEFYIGKDGQYIGLKITYGDNQVLNYDYTSDVWNSIFLF